MKKFFVLFCVLVLLAGCNKKGGTLDEEKYNSYIKYYQDILANTKLSESNDFEVELVINKLSNDEYRYDLIIDQPKVAMYNIKILAVVEDLTGKVNNEIMMPSIGIIDDKNLNMIPSQVDIEKGFVKGVALSLVSNEDKLRINYLVIYDDTSGKEVKTYYTIYNVYTQPEQENIDGN